MMTARKLPDIAFLRSLLIVGTPGTGKSYNTAEQRVIPCLEKRQQVVIIDPTDAWYGLRLSKSGKRSSGYDIAVFGGDHGDMQLTPNMGKALGELLGTKPISAILSMQHFELDEQVAFMADFTTAIMRHNKKPINLVIDEADEFIPQERSTDKMANKCRLRCKRIVTRGRKQGFRPVLITQRPQVLDTSVRNLCQVLVAMQLPGTHERKMIDDYVKNNGDVNAVKEMVESLGGLEVGEAWVWAPRGKFLERIKFGPLSVFDSFKELDDASESIKMMPLDDKALAGVHVALAQFIEQQKANDPEELRRQLQEAKGNWDRSNRERERLAEELERERAAPKGVDPKILMTVAELGQDAGYKFGFGDGYKLGQMQAYTRNAEWLHDQKTVPAPEIAIPDMPPVDLSKIVGRGTPQLTSVGRAAITSTPAYKSGDQVTVQRGRKTEQFVVNGTSDDISGPEQRIIDAIAWWNVAGVKTPTRHQVAAIAKQSSKSSSFDVYLGRAKRAGLIEYPEKGILTLTHDGAAKAKYPSAPPSRTELHERLCEVIGETEAKILRAMISAYPRAVDKPSLAAAAGASVKSSSFDVYLGRVARLGVIEKCGDGTRKAAQWLFAL